MAKIDRENKQRERFNNRNNKKFSDNETYLKTFEHH